MRRDLVEGDEGIGVGELAFIGDVNIDEDEILVFHHHGQIGGNYIDVRSSLSDRHDLKSPSYDLLNMRLGYAARQWSVALWARNLTDEDYYVRGFGTFGNDPRKEYAVEPYYQYGEPRVVGVSTRFSF